MPIVIISIIVTMPIMVVVDVTSRLKIAYDRKCACRPGKNTKRDSNNNNKISKHERNEYDLKINEKDCQ